MMQGSRSLLFCLMAGAITVSPAYGATLKSSAAFNTGIGKKTDSQPKNGVQVAYQVTLKGGDLDGCTVDVVESLFGREEGAWGIFDIAGDLKCKDGGFSYTSSGSWDGNGFHAAGAIKDGSCFGKFVNISGRVAQGGGGKAASDGTTDISYNIVFDTAE